jgi:3alpha(or 20beta)-hydroxysteroid dehydrogenase
VIGADLTPTAPDERVAMRALDVTDEQQWGAFAAWLRREHGACHGLVNNAGITMRTRLGEVSLEDWNRTLAINVAVRCSGCRRSWTRCRPGPRSSTSLQSRR